MLLGIQANKGVWWSSRDLGLEGRPAHTRLGAKASRCFAAGLGHLMGPLNSKLKVVEKEGCTQQRDDTT